MFKVIDSAVPGRVLVVSVGHNDVNALLSALQQDSASSGRRLFFRLRIGAAGSNLDLPALEHEFHRLSRKLHPDRFARALDNEKQWSLADTALLNDAYRTLKDPLRRTEYLLKLDGAEMADDHGKAKEPKERRECPPICSKRSST